MKKKYMNVLFLIFILALPFSWANIGPMSIYRLVTIVVFSIWILQQKFKIPIPVDDRRKYFLAWITYAGYAILAIILYPANINVAFGMILLVMISLVFFSSQIDVNWERYVDYMWLAAALFFIVLFLSGKSGQVGDWGARKTLVILGTSTDANEFSSFFVVALPIAFFNIVNEKGIIKKIVCAIILILGIYVVLMAGSRAALLSVIVALIITAYGVIKPSAKSVILLIIISIILLIFIPKYVIPMIPEATLSRLSVEALRSDQGSGRSEIWALALHIFADCNPLNWIVGCGYGGLKVSYSIGDTSTMHNQYLQQLVSYGVIGTILYFRFIYLAYKRIKKKYRRYIGAYVGMMIMAMTITMGPSYKILWILLFIAGCAKE